MKIKKLFLIFLLCILQSCAIKREIKQDFHTPPSKWEEPRLYFTEFDRSFEKNVDISRMKIQDSEVEKKISPNNAYWFKIIEPDFNKEGPWSTEIYIFNERDYLIKIVLKEHSNYIPEVFWINDKYLHIKVWWGRVLGSIFIYDVEKERIVIKEMIHDGTNIFNQYHGEEK